MKNTKPISIFFVFSALYDGLLGLAFIFAALTFKKQIFLRSYSYYVTTKTRIIVGLFCDGGSLFGAE